MGTAEWLSVLVGLTGVLVTIVGGTFALLIRTERRLASVEEIVKRELSPNSGKSLRDRIVRMEYRILAMHPELRDFD